MATEIVYAHLDLGPGGRCGKRLSHPELGPPGCPRWHRSGNFLLEGTVVAPGCSFLHLQPESPGNDKIGNGNIGDINSTRENILSELSEVLCPSQSPGAEGCRICPQGWTLGRTKCYWIQPLHQELRNVTLQKPVRCFWIRLFVPVSGTGWTWLDGSGLD